MGWCLMQDILVYDVSRQGRFQDADESAYHEFICETADVVCDIESSKFKTTIS